MGRSGLACADCHAAPGEAALRPAPALGAVGSVIWGGRSVSVAAAIDLCADRYLARPPLPAEVRGDLRALLAARPVAEGPDVAGWDGVALYDQACRHCHEEGPGGVLIDRPLSRTGLVAMVRGADRPRHPATFMPAFAAARLSDAALARLVDWLVTAR
ncbi:MAG: c-type cytochrome [Myxococcales bacterium]|nr:c-type cytochrome [Myxococcales bacterium]